MPNALETLRNIIDDQNVENLQCFIQENPNINYDNICPNGASALWWALMPPAGKKANKAIIKCLLKTRKEDGSYLVNPVQTFSGLTPRQYLKVGIIDDYRNVNRIVELAENRYVRPQRADAHLRNLAAIAADGQSAHDSTISSLSRGNIINLYQHYVAERSHPLDKNTVEMAGKEIEAVIRRLQKEQTENAEQIQYGLRFCYSNTSRFEFQSSEENKESFSLTLAQLVALNWLAAKEQDAALLPFGAIDKEALESRKKAILIILYDIATAYGKNGASCAGGACSRLGMALASQHKLARAYPVGEKITGEVASLVFLRILGQTIEQLSKDNKVAYWAVIRYLTLTDNDAEEIKSYEAFINANKEKILARMREENIDEKWAAIAIAVLEEGDYPLANHKTSYQLFHLMSIMHKHQLDLTLFDGNTSIKKAVDEAVDILVGKLLNASESYNLLKEKFGINREYTGLALEKNFILNWLELARRGQRSDDLHSFIKAHKPSEFSEQCFLFSIFSTNKERLKRENPAQAKWLDNLTDEHIITLMSEVFPKEIAEVGDLIQPLILKAMELGFTSNFIVEGIHFKNEDLRAFDFSGATLKNVTFENCLLPLAGTNIHCSNINLINCRLPCTEDLAFMKALDFSDLCRNRGYVPSSLAVQFYLEPSKNPEYEFFDIYVSALNHAALSGYAAIVKAIIESDKCSQELFESTLGSKTILIWASIARSAATVKEILANAKCSRELLEHTDLYGNTALLEAAFREQTDIVKEILANANCSRKLLEHADVNGHTVLIWAASHGYTDMVQEILVSDKCSLKLLQHADTDGRTASDWASHVGQPEIAKQIRTCIAYQTLWESKESEADKILAVLDDYCKGTGFLKSRLSVFAHGHFNRHHTGAVRQLLKEYKPDDSINDLLVKLRDLEKNETGSLARRLKFIESRMSHLNEPQETQQEQPRPAALG